MADSSRTIMTDAGFALETRVRADETKMQFTRAAISTDDHFSDTDDALAKLTELSNIQQDGKVTAVQVINTTTVYVQVDVNQAESKADYQMRSAALYAKDDDGTEVLYGVTVLQDPVFVHKDADGSYLGFGINTTVGRASNVVVVVDPANMVTQQVFEGTMKNYYTKAEVDAKFVTDDDFASKLPKNIATTDAANTFAKSQTLAGGATDGKGNAYATTKDVATGLNNGFNTKVNVSDMRKPASDVAGIEEVNAKQDKIGYTPADDSKVVHSTVTQLTSTDMNTVLAAGFYSLNSGTNGMPNADAWTIYQVIPLPSFNGVQLAYRTNNAILGMRSWHNGNTFTSWVQFADDSKVVHSTDTSNWQKQKITNDDGSIIKRLTVSNNDDLNNYLGNLVGGYTTFYVQSGVTNNPSTQSARGFILKETSNNGGPDYGMGYLVDNAGSTWSISVSSSTTPTYKLLANDSAVVHSTDMRKPANQVASIDEVNAKQDKLDYTPANAANVVDRNPDTGVVSKPVDFTKLTVNGGKSVATSDDLNNFYHANASDEAALAAAKASTVSGIYWYEED